MYRTRPVVERSKEPVGAILGSELPHGKENGSQAQPQLGSTPGDAMSGPADLRDRLHRDMLASDRVWSSEEIAREVLKIVSDASRADRLVGAVLGGDTRFVRDGVSWRARSARAPSLESGAFLLCDLPPTNTGGSVTPLCVRVWEPVGVRTGPIIEIGIDGAGLEDAEGILEGRVPVSATAAAARRRLHGLERTHALPAISERMLDLAALLRLAGEALPGPLSSPEPASSEERLGATAAALERALALFGTLSLDEVEAKIEGSLQTRPVDFSRYAFTRSDLDGIPERPGVYRFFGGGEYAPLRRQVARPPPADRQLLPSARCGPPTAESASRLDPESGLGERSLPSWRPC